MSQSNGNREHWGSRMGFIMAAAGSAIGLGNVWKFPFITGMYGGAAFVLWYLISILVIGLPVMLIEFAIGRRTQLNPVGAFRTLAPNSKYFLIGGLGIFAGFLILSYYSVVAGWTIAYIYKAAVGGFQGFHSPEIAAEAFKSYVTSPIWPIVTHAVFMFLCAIIVVGGIKKGIERWNTILMPLLFFILIVLVIRGVTLKGSGAGLTFLLAPDFSKLTGNGMLVAMGHAFFTLSLGMGAMLTYGSYLKEDENLIRCSFWIIFLDTMVALLAGVAVYSAVFAFGFKQDMGPALVFNVLPAIFAVMPMGYVVAILFFILLMIAALTSGISLLEVVTAYFVDQRGWSRKKAVIVFSIVIFILGVPSALSFGMLGKVMLFNKTIFDFADYFSFKFLLPIGGLLMVLFTLIRWRPANLIAEIRKGSLGLKISVATATVYLVISALFVLVTFIAGLSGI